MHVIPQVDMHSLTVAYGKKPDPWDLAKILIVFVSIFTIHACSIRTEVLGYIMVQARQRDDRASR